MTFHQYERVTPAPPDIEEPEPMENADGSELLKKVLAELARVGAAMVALFTALWFFAAPAARDFVIQIIDQQKLADESEVSELKSAVRNVVKEQVDLGKQIEHQGAQIDNIEQLAREQRALANTILLELRKP